MPDNLDGAVRDDIEPSHARVYDYLLGGHHYSSADREFAERCVAQLPDLVHVARSQRAFTVRAVRHSLAAGITQFIDLGSGLPSQGQAHEIADATVPEAEVRVVYVDNEPAARARPHLLLARGTDPARHRAVSADFHDFNDLWGKVVQTGVIREGEPTCLIATGILHHLPPETKPESTMAFYREQLAAGSHLVLTHFADTSTELCHVLARTGAIQARTRDGFAAFFGDWVVVAPGLSWTVRWRPDGAEERWWGDDPARAGILAGVAIKPIALG